MKSGVDPTNGLTHRVKFLRPTVRPVSPCPQQRSSLRLLGRGLCRRGGERGHRRGQTRAESEDRCATSGVAPGPPLPTPLLALRASPRRFGDLLGAEPPDPAPAGLRPPDPPLALRASLFRVGHPLLALCASLGRSAPRLRFAHRSRASPGVSRWRCVSSGDRGWCGPWADFARGPSRQDEPLRRCRRRGPSPGATWRAWPAAPGRG